MSTWITPVTDRKDGTARMTNIDMNRITGNLDYLFTDLLPSKGFTPLGATVKKTSWTQNDIIGATDWEDILDVLDRLITASGFEQKESVTNAMYYQNINTLEEYTLAIYRIALYTKTDASLNHWIGDPFYSGDEINAGGLYT